MPLAEKIYPKKYFGMSNCVFNFNFLAIVVSEILKGVPNLHKGAYAPLTPPSGEFFVL